MPEVVQEVRDFKAFVHGYIRDGADRLVGLGRCTSSNSLSTNGVGPSCAIRRKRLMSIGFQEISQRFVYERRKTKEDP